MTDLTDLTDDFFATALAGIQARLDDLITQPKSESDPPDKWAKSFSALMKAEADAKAEDEARFHERFRRIMRDILDARGVD